MGRYETVARAPRGTVVATIATGVVLGTLALFALRTLGGSAHDWGGAHGLMPSILVALPLAFLLSAVATRPFNFAWAMYWAWSFVFLGLAPAYQLSGGAFPWGAQFQKEHLVVAQVVIIVGHAAVAAGFFGSRWLRTLSSGSGRAAFHDGARLRRGMTVLLVGHIGMVAAFTLIMGPALISGRARFSAQLIANGTIPGFGTLYFLANAGAIILPAMAIILRKAGVGIPRAVVIASVAASFIATNPLIGSRFLTGSFLVALVGAAVGEGTRRWIPLGMVLAFVTVFPTLDLLRGDNTGASRVQIATPAENLSSFDFDAFEMLTRATIAADSPVESVSNFDLLIAPFLRWVPGLSEMVTGNASGSVVAEMTGMTYTNVSMPLWAESYLVGGWGWLTVVMLAVGLIMARSGASPMGRLLDAPLAALFMIVLRGSLYEVLGYVMLTMLVAWWVARRAGRDPVSASGFSDRGPTDRRDSTRLRLARAAANQELERQRPASQA